MKPLCQDSIDSIVVQELQDAYELVLEMDNTEDSIYIEPDWKLIESMEVVLKHYMTKPEYEEWMQHATLKKLTVMGELGC